jgi:hypothetical protein
MFPSLQIIPTDRAIHLASRQIKSKGYSLFTMLLSLFGNGWVEILVILLTDMFL